MKIKNLIILITSVIAVLLLLIAALGIYSYIKAAESGNAVFDVPEKSHTATLGKLFELEISGFIPWGQDVSAISLQPGSSFIAAGEPRLRVTSRNINGRNIAIALPIRAINIGKNPAGSLHLSVDRPMYTSLPEKLQLTLDLPEITVEPRLRESSENLPLADELHAPEVSPKLRIIAIIAALVIVLAVGIWYLQKALFKRSLAAQTPWAKAKSRLQELREQIKRNEKTPEWCIRQLTDLLRDYLAERFDLPICQQTTGEFFDSLKNHPALLSIEQIDYLEDFLTQADLIKFACFRAAPEQLAKAIDRAGKLIDETSGNTNNTNSATSMEQVK